MTGFDRPGSAAQSVPLPEGWGRRWVRRFAFAAAAFLVADLIVGFTVFSVMILGIVWYFALEWIQLAQLAGQHGLVFGSFGQVRMAEGVLVVAPLGVAWVVYLGVQAIRLPRGLWSSGRTTRSLLPAAGLVAPPSAPDRGRRRP